IEIHEQDRFAVHADVAQVVDAVLRGQPARPQSRVRRSDGGVDVEPGRPASAPAASADEPEPTRRPLRIFPSAVSRERLDRAIRDLGVDATISMHPRNADVVLTLRALAKKQPKKLRELMVDSTRVHAINANTQSKISEFLRELFELPSGNH